MAYCSNRTSHAANFTPIRTNSNFLLTMSKPYHEMRLWELIKWSPKRKYFDLLSNSLNSFFKEIYRDEFREFVCGYWGLKGSKSAESSYHNLVKKWKNRPFHGFFKFWYGPVRQNPSTPLGKGVLKLVKSS